MANAPGALVIPLPAAVVGPTRISFTTAGGEQGDLIIAENTDNGPLLLNHWSAIVSAIQTALTSAGANSTSSNTVTVS